MEWLFFKILDMSAAASCCIVVVLFLRLCLRKMPKLLSYMLWFIVLARLLCPVMAESRFGILPPAGQQDALYEELGQMVRDRMTSGSSQALPGEAPLSAWGIEPSGEVPGDSVQQKKEPLAGEGILPEEKEEPTKKKAGHGSIWAVAGSGIWFAGCCAILIYSVLVAGSLKRRLATAKRCGDGCFESVKVESPFLFGIITPRIYLPPRIGEPERSYILAHEKVHIRRKDYLVKPLFFVAVAVHWFNPFVWVAWKYMCKDMEMSCDEAVLGQLGENARKDYSKALLKLSVGYPVLVGGPLAFGENDTKARIKNIASYKKPVFWAFVAALLIFSIAAVLLLTNRKPPEEQSTEKDNVSLSEPGTTEEIGSVPDSIALEITEEAEEYNRSARALKRGEALTWDKLEELAELENPELEDYAGYDGAEWSERMGVLSAIREDLVYYLTDEETGNRYRLYLSYYIENNSIEFVNLIKMDGSALLLYSSYDEGRKRDADILAFRQYAESLSDWISDYTVPKADLVAAGEYFPEGGYGYGGIEFIWTGPNAWTTNGREDFGYSVWKAAGGIMRYPKESIHVPEALDYESFIFQDGELVEVNIRGLNHTSKKGETTKLEGCEESAVLFCLNHDLFTASDIAEAEERGQEIPEDEQTADIWYAAVAKEGASYGYIVYLNARYYSKEEVAEFAKSLRFTEQAWR